MSHHPRIVEEIQDLLRAHHGRGDRVMGRITCEDGFGVSVQASYFHFSTPRNNTGPWSAVECGYPSYPPDEWHEHFNESIYPFIPIEKVAAVLERHGGIKLIGPPPAVGQPERSGSKRDETSSVRPRSNRPE